MKLKYYLRGIGIGVVITTIIFMISISIHKNDLESQNIPSLNSESKTVAEVQNSTQETVDVSAEADTQQSEENNTKNSETTETASEVKSSDKNTEEKETETAAETKKDTVEIEKETTETKTQPVEKSDEKVRFEVGGGEYSDVICRKLVEAGLIDDAEAFNKYLIQKNYDNFILPGVYDIPKDSTYEEIAVLLTTKVEKETAQ